MTEYQKRAALALRDQLTVMGQRDIPTNRDGFDDEFDSLRHLDHRTRQNRDEFYTALRGSNMSKNRYADVLPNEATRVVLDPINARGDGDYINANYIDGRRLFGVPFVYIATQAPVRASVGDFWRMVYENNTAFIVMLCADIEAGKQKSEKYWPEGQGGVMQLGPLSLVILSENHRADTIFRTILIRTVDGKERKVFHMQYVRWPDQGIPQSSAPLMEVIMALGRSPLSTQTPIVVHCSGGVGRTGVFITLHVALALFQLEKPVSVPHIVQHLKLCRTGLVQRKDQYLFAYYAILREMDRMVWASEQSVQVDALLHQQQQQGTGRQVPVPRRPSEHVPMHVAQFVGNIPRSSMATGNRGAPSSEHGIYMTRHVPTRQVDADEFGPSVVSQAFDPEGGFAYSDSGAMYQQQQQQQLQAPGNSMEEQLRQLQQKTKSMRSHANVTSGSRGNRSGFATAASAFPLSATSSSKLPDRVEQQPLSSRAAPPAQKLSLEDPRLSSAQSQVVVQQPFPSLQQGLPPLSVAPQLDPAASSGLPAGHTAAATPTHRPIVMASDAPTEEPQMLGAGAGRSSVGGGGGAIGHQGSAAGGGVILRGSDSLFFSPEPSRPQQQQQRREESVTLPPASYPMGGEASSSAGGRPPHEALRTTSDLYAAARDFNSALFAPVSGAAANGQTFTTGRSSAVRKADVGLL